jgi:hypothetical protein
MVPGSDVVWETRFGGTKTMLSGKEAKIAPRSGMIFQAVVNTTN